MSNNSKDTIQYITAVVMLASGIVLSFFSFFRNGDVVNGVLWYTGQTIMYAGGIFGIAMYVKAKGGELKNYIDRRLGDE